MPQSYSSESTTEAAASRAATAAATSFSKASSSAQLKKHMKPKVANLVPFPRGKRPPSPEDTAVSRARVRFEGVTFSSHKKMRHVAQLASRLGAR